MTTSSTTAHSGGGAANDLIVADSTEYAKAQQLNSTTGGVAGGLKVNIDNSDKSRGSVITGEIQER